MTITWYTCRANKSDVEYDKSLPPDKRENIKVGDVLWRVPHSIGPINIDHSHWAGWHLDCEESDAILIAAAPDMLDTIQAVDEFCQMGLNSSNPSHWEAALQDIMNIARATIAKARGTA